MSKAAAALSESRKQSNLRLLARMIFHMWVHATWITLLFPFAMLAALFHPRSGSVWMARRLYAPVLIYFSRAKLVVHGAEHVDPKRPTIYVCNHQSSFDVPVTFAAIRVNFRYVAKQSLRWVPVLGWFIWFTGHILIDRSNRSSAIRTLDKAARRIREGTSVVVFPEGTRSPDGRILPFKKGPFALALKSGVAVCPVTIEGSGRLMPKNSWKVQTGGEVHVVIGKPIDASSYAPHERERLMRDVRNQIIAQSLQVGGKGGDVTDVIAPGEEGRHREPPPAPLADREGSNA